MIWRTSCSKSAKRSW